MLWKTSSLLVLSKTNLLRRSLLTRWLCSSSAIVNATQWKDVLDYWFVPGAEKKWFFGGSEVDREIKEHFGKMVDRAQQGGLKDWELEPMPSLALLILCDQFSRNIFRGSLKAFAGDERAREITRKFLERKSHDELKQSFSERIFIYMPMMHSEDQSNQELSVKLYEGLANDTADTALGEQITQTLDFAKRHKEVVDKFGRFPQRNSVLGRPNTKEEEEFLNNTPDGYKW